jgi:hypothetical protein
MYDGKFFAGVLFLVWISVTVGFSSALALCSWLVLRLFLDNSAAVVLAIPLGVAYWLWLWKMVTHFRRNMHLPAEELIDEMEAVMASPEQRDRMKQLRQQQSSQDSEGSLGK